MISSVLRALEPDPIPVADLAREAGLSEAETHAELERLVSENLAIEEEGGFELSGPLSWFGNFENCVRYFARRGFLVRVPGENDSHLFLADVRIKGVRRAGDPLNETVAVLACGRTSRQVQQANDASGLTCADCKRAVGEYGSGGPHGLQIPQREDTHEY